MNRLFLTLGVAASAAAAYVYSRAKEVADREGRPLADVLAEMPGRIMADLQTIGDDLRDAADEGRQAADQHAEDFDREMADAPPPPPEPTPTPEAAESDPDDEPTQ
jgi:hypothetical protein